MLDFEMDSLAATTTTNGVESNRIDSLEVRKNSPYLSLNVYKPGAKGELEALMNGPIKQKLTIIPPNVTYVPINPIFFK